MANRSKRKGTDYENLVVEGLRFLPDGATIHRAPQWGAHDKGDVVNAKVRRTKPVAVVVCCPVEDEPLAIEAKNVAKLSLPLATKEAKVERDNLGALAGVVVHKRYGSRDPLAQWVTMTMADLLALMSGERVEHDSPNAVQRVAAAKSGN